MCYYHQNKVAVKIVHIFNTYWPHMHSDDGRVISNFIVQTLRDEDLTIYGNGSKTKSFCDDMAQGLLFMMDTPINFTGPFNLGNPIEITILELAEKIISLSGSSSKIVFKPLPDDDPRRRRPDINLVRNKLKWEPTVNLERGLKDIISYYCNILNIA